MTRAEAKTDTGIPDFPLVGVSVHAVGAQMPVDLVARHSVASKQETQMPVLCFYRARRALHVKGCLDAMLFVVSQPPLQVFE